MLEFTDEIFDVATGIVVIDFWSPRCGPCVMLAPVFEKVANNNPDITFAKVNASENHYISSFYSINAVPTIIFFKNGEIVKKLVGFQSEVQLTKVIEEVKK